MGRTKKVKPVHGLYSVVKFRENKLRLFECIPDRWFLNEEKESCYWPPKNGKNFMVLAMNQETTNNSWEMFRCEVVSEGHSMF